MKKTGLKTSIATCDRCKKDKPVFKKITRGVDKLKFCQTCANIFLREEAKTKRKEKRTKKAEIITEKKLDTIFSKWIRLAYPSFCHSTGIPGQFGDFHCSHFIGRANRAVRFDTRNCYPCFASENMYNQLHVIKLAEHLKKLYGIEWEDFNAAAKQTTVKFTSHDRREFYDIFNHYIKEVQDLREQFKGNELHIKLSEVRKQVISLTAKILKD